MKANSHPQRDWGIWGIVGVLALATAVRLPFLAESLAVPVDGDTGIAGLMAVNRVGRGTFWGQPYGSPVESWLILPFIELLGPTRLALRLAYMCMNLALVPLAFLLARALQPAAGLPAALLLACPPAVLLGYAALPLPLYPMTLILVALGLLAALSAVKCLERNTRSYRLLMATWALCGALAVWTHFVSIIPLLAGAAFLAFHTWSRPRRLAEALIALAVAMLPAIAALAEGPSTSEVLASRLEHVWTIVPGMHRTLSELVGGRTAAVTDLDPEIVSPGWVQAVLGAGYLAGALSALRVRRRSAAALLWATILLVVAVFPFPLRSHPSAVRFILPAYLPLAALSMAGAARVSSRAAWALASLLVCLHLLPSPDLIASWRRGAHSNPFSPDCTPARVVLESLGLRRGYASYNTAYCITYESGERIVVSQPWNERFASHPLPYLDEVRFAAEVAWILRPADDFGMPSPERFEELLRAAGGTWRRTDHGGFFIYHSFVAPFPDRVSEAPVRLCGETLTLPLSPPRKLSGITVIAQGSDRPLPHRLMVETSTADDRFDLLWSRRRPRALTKLVWLNGNPRFAIDPHAVAVTIPEGRPIAGVRVTTTDADACAVIGPVLLHGDSGGRWAPTMSLTDSDWGERRRILNEQPRPDSAGWHYRRLVAEQSR